MQSSNSLLLSNQLLFFAFALHNKHRRGRRQGRLWLVGGGWLILLPSSQAASPSDQSANTSLITICTHAPFQQHIAILVQYTGILLIMIEILNSCVINYKELIRPMSHCHQIEYTCPIRPKYFLCKPPFFLITCPTEVPLLMLKCYLPSIRHARWH